MKTITVKAAAGRSVPLSASCRRPDAGSRVITIDQGEVALELLDAAGELYVQRAIRRGDLLAVAKPAAAPAVRTTQAAPAAKE